jgi:hypothetical protein
VTPAEKYGRPQELPPAIQTQVRDIGETLKSKGVTYEAGAAQTPAMKYAAPANSHLERSLSQGRSL